MNDEPIIRNCQTAGQCNYKTFGNGFNGCSFNSYCDFQLPKDSRLNELKLYFDEVKNFNPFETRDKP